MLLLLAVMRKDVCYALGFPAYIFLAQLKHFFPVSNSAGAALFPLAAGMAAFFKSFRLRFGLCEKLLIALAVLMVASLTYSLSPVYGRDKAALFCFMVVPVVVLAPNVITNIKSLRTVTSIIGFTCVIFVLVSMVMRVQFRIEDGRSAGMFEATRAGQYLGLAAIISFIYVVYRYEIGRKVIFLGVMILATLLMFMSGTRGAVLAFALSMIFIYWFVHLDCFQRIFTKAHITIASVVLVVAAVFLGGYFLKSALPAKVYQRFSKLENFFDNFTADKFENWRDVHTRTFNYMSAMHYFADHPLTGAGAGGYKEVLAMYGDIRYKKEAADANAHAYPHNVILEFACEQGILGLILILWIIFLNFRMILRLRKAYSRDPQNRFLILVCALMYFYGLCVAMTSLDIPRMMILWWGMGLLIAADKLYRSELRLPLKEQGKNGDALCFVKKS